MIVLCVLIFAGVANVLTAQPADETGGLVDPNTVPLGSGVTPMQRPVRPMPANRITPPSLPSGMAVTQPAATQPVFTGPPPSVKVDEPVYDFKTLMGVDSVSHTFKLRNVGEGPLTIEAVQPTCGCTTASNWEKTVPPGAVWELPITVRLAGFDGRVTKYINVRTNDPKNRDVRFTVTGEVRARFKYQPAKQFQLGRCTRDAVVKNKITITNQLDKPVKFKSATTDSKFFKAEIKEIKEGKEYEIELSTVPPLNEGFTQAKVTIETDCKEEPKIELFGYAQVPQRLTLAPTVVAVPTPVQDDARRSLTFRNEGTTPVHVKEVTTPEPTIKAEINATEEGKLYQIWLTIPKGLNIPPTGLPVTVVTDDAQTPKFNAQIRGYSARPTTMPTPFGRPPGPGLPQRPVAPAATPAPAGTPTP